MPGFRPPEINVMDSYDPTKISVSSTPMANTPSAYTPRKRKMQQKLEQAGRAGLMLLQENDVIKAKLEATEEARAAQEDVAQALQTQLSDSSDQLRAVKHHHHEALEALRRQATENQLLVTEITEHETEVERLKAQLDKMEEENRDLSLKSAAASEELEHMREKESSLKAEMDHARRLSMNGVRRQLRPGEKVAEERVLQLTAQLEEEQKRAEALEVEYAKLLHDHADQVKQRRASIEPTSDDTATPDEAEFEKWYKENLMTSSLLNEIERSHSQALLEGRIKSDFKSKLAHVSGLDDDDADEQAPEEDRTEDHVDDKDVPVWSAASVSPKHAPGDPTFSSQEPTRLSLLHELQGVGGLSRQGSLMSPALRREDTGMPLEEILAKMEAMQQDLREKEKEIDKLKNTQIAQQKSDGGGKAQSAGSNKTMVWQEIVRRLSDVSTKRREVRKLKLLVRRHASMDASVLTPMKPRYNATRKPASVGFFGSLLECCGFRQHPSVARKMRSSR